MKQREVQDDKTQWTCVQAMSGLGGDAAELAEAKVEAGGGDVSVVCTPRGGAKSVHLALPVDWDEHLSDEALLQAIHAAQ